MIPIVISDFGMAHKDLEKRSEEESHQSTIKIT